MHAEDVKASLRKKYRTLQSFEKIEGLPANSATAALRRPYRQVEKAISKALGLPAFEIWPSRYDAAGRRLSPQPTANYAPARGARRA